ncbi:MAG: GNAT family N-acetyltransferase [Anaerolineales bacterium]
MRIVTLTMKDTALIEQAAQLLVDAFREHWPAAWPTLDDGLEEIHDLLEEGCICRVAIDERGSLLGLVGGMPQYDGHVWELHPLAVWPHAQGQGIGRALVQDFEAQVRQRGGVTIFLGSDDEDNMTSLAGVDLYHNLWEKIRTIQNYKGHPYSFYQKMGYAIVGVIPDANGPGKPDILMAKRVGG